VRCQPWRKAKGLHRAKCYRAPFAVRPEKKTHGKEFAVRFKAFAVRALVAQGKVAVSRSETRKSINTTFLLLVGRCIILELIIIHTYVCF
jgi:hypothetical protein